MGAGPPVWEALAHSRPRERPQGPPGLVGRVNTTVSVAPLDSQGLGFRTKREAWEELGQVMRRLESRQKWRDKRLPRRTVLKPRSVFEV